MYLQHLIVFGVLVNVTPQLLIEDHGCEKVTVKDHLIQAYAGWPFSLTCALFDNNGVVYEYFYDGYSGYENDKGVQFLCQIIRSNGTMMLNRTLSQDDELSALKTLVFPNPQVADSANFRMNLLKLNSVSCWTIDITLTLTAFRSTSCLDYVDSHSITYIPTNFGARKEYQCVALSPKDIPLADYSFFTYQWLRNCSNILPENVTVNENNEILFDSADFDQAGIYTCAVTYNGMTRYTSFYEMCVQHPVTLNRHVLTCAQDTIYKNENEEAVFECTGDFGNGQYLDLDVKFYWKKRGGIRTFCEQEDDKRALKHCTYTLNEVCYLYNPEDAKKEKLRAIIPVRLAIRKISESDYGEYIISASSNLQHSIVLNHTVTLKRDHTPALLRTAALVGGCIGAAFLVILLVVITVYNSIYLKVFYKVYFGKHVLDNKDYGACLVYNYSLDNDQCDKSDVKSSVITVSAILQGMGYKVFDEQKEYCNGTKTECVKYSIERSHRVIIFLTEEFIEEEWSMFQFYMGFNEMIQSGSKLIFILLPKMKEHLKRHQQDDLTCQAIQSAIKANCSIVWPDKRNSSKRRFLFEIKAAMPKLHTKKPNAATMLIERGFNKKVEIPRINFEDTKC